MKSIGFMMLFVGASGAVLAGTVPEIDPASGVGALALLSMRARRKK
jgi:hypothetical protein